MRRPAHCWRILLSVAVLILFTAGCHSRESSADSAASQEPPQSSEWFYESFDDTRRAAYDAFRKATQNPFTPDPVLITGADGDKTQLPLSELALVYQGFLYDHPEVFWLSSSFHYRVSGTTAGEELADAVGLIPIPQSGEELSEQIRLFESAAQQMLDKADRAADDKERAAILYNCIIENTQYREEALYDNTLLAEHTAYGAIVGKAAVCDGIALAYKYLLDRCGIASIVIPGRSAGNPHVWITVFWEGRWHEADPTWDIASKDNEKGQYFDLTTKEMNKDHLRETKGIASSIPFAK